MLGGAVGAPARYLIDQELRARHRGRRLGRLPVGIFAVNVAGSLILGLVAGVVAHGAPAWLLTLVGTGFCGALTTFSTFGLDTVTLAESGRSAAAFANVGLSLMLGLAACAGGWVLGSAL